VTTPSDEAPPARPPASSRAARLGPVVVAGAVAVLALVETVVAAVAPALAPTDGDWQAAAREIRAGFQAGDLIVAAPAWADPIMRVHLGDLVPAAVAGRLDDARFGRVWEVSQRGARAPEAARGKVGLEHKLGALTVRRVDRPPAVVTYDFVERWGDARMSGGQVFRRQIVEVDTRLRQALLAPPVVGGTVAVEYPAVTLGRELMIGTGLHDVWARKYTHADVHLRVVVAGTPAAAITANNETGWQLTRIDTAAYQGRVVSVRFEITSPAPAGRNFAFAAEARR
jgi:hypothetical protein